MPEIAWLKSLGWQVLDGWTVKGDKEVEAVFPDRYSQYITDKRFAEFKRDFDIESYLGL